MVPHLALLLLLCRLSLGFERSVGAKSHTPSKPRPVEIDSTALFVSDTDLKKKIEEGGKAIAKFQDSHCWLEAKAGLIATQCNNLHSDEKERLTIALTNCHLERTGLDPILCAPDVPVADCLKQLKLFPMQFGAYTEFVFHFDNVCFFVKREAFQEDTQRAVNSLYAATLETSVNLQSFARNADEARVHLSNLIQDQQNEFNNNLEEFHQNHMEKFENLSKAAELLDAKQDGMVNALQQKSEALHGVLEKSLAIQQDVQSNQSSLLEQFSRANQTLSRLEDQQITALALVHSTTENLEELSRTQRNAFSETNRSLLSLAQRQTIIDSSLQKSLEASTKLNSEQVKLFELLSQQKAQLENGQRNLLTILSATNENLSELSAKQKASFENSSQQFSLIANTTTAFAQNIHAQLDESKKVQELALQRVNGGFAAISSSQDEIHERQQQLLSSVEGTHGKLAELQQKNKDSFEAASTHLASIREQSQQAEERVQKVMAGLENRLEQGFQRVLSLDHSILGELFTIKAVVFYASCSAAIFFCTASKQTQRIRPHLFLAIAINYYMEMQALYFTDWFLFTDHVLVVSLLRKLFVGSVCLSLGFAAWRFRDYHELSYDVAIQNQNMLCVMMQHLRKRAMQDNFDTSDLDSALAFASPEFKRQFQDLKLGQKNQPSQTPDLPPLEPIQRESKHSQLPPILEDPTEKTHTEIKECAIEDSAIGVEQVTEEPREAPLSPRCPAIAKSSGVQCKKSARKCRSHAIPQIQL